MGDFDEPSKDEPKVESDVGVDVEVVPQVAESVDSETLASAPSEETTQATQSEHSLPSEERVEHL